MDVVPRVAEILGDEGVDSDAILDDLHALPTIPNGKDYKGPWRDEMRET